MRVEQSGGEIVGQSRALRHVMQQVETVACTDATVLLLGETGTGKEVFARAVHTLSSRRDQPLVRADCALIPAGLLESELFGHERGAFTGAVARSIGRIEMASKGTLFLDEVGDIPLELQSKLLRVLQEREFERLGSSRTIRVDFRLVAATNVHHGWPGNVRELQNVVERSVVVSTGTVLALSRPAEAKQMDPSPANPTLAEAERELILQVLRNTDWVLGGPNGAAVRLGVKRTTLLYKMRRLGIGRPPEETPPAKVLSRSSTAKA